MDTGNGTDNWKEIKNETGAGQEKEIKNGAGAGQEKETTNGAGAGQEREIKNGAGAGRGMNMGNGMNPQDRTQTRAGEIMKSYRKHKWISNAIVLADIIFLIYMVVFKMDYRIDYIVGGFASLMLTVGVFALYAVFAAIAILIKWLGAVQIDKALYEECDPFVYEACLDKLHPFFYKERFAALHAMARYYKGDSRSAEQILRNVNLYKLKGIHRLNYYILMSAICFERGEGFRAAELEQSYRRSLKKDKKEEMFFRTLCASNNLFRAMENKDYPAAFRFLFERKTLDSGKCRKWTHIGHSLWEARICAGLGDEKSARMNLEYVIAEGGRLVYVREAKELLQTLDGGRTDASSTNGEINNE